MGYYAVVQAFTRPDRLRWTARLHVFDEEDTNQPPRPLADFAVKSDWPTGGTRAERRAAILDVIRVEARSFLERMAQADRDHGAIVDNIVGQRFPATGGLGAAADGGAV